MSPSRIFPLLALCLTVLFLALFVWGGLQVKLMKLPEPWLPAADSLQPVVVVLPDSTQEVGAEIIERPLFWAGRRPYVADSDPAPSPVVAARGADPLDKASLVGTFMAQGSAGVIVELDGSRQRLMVGDTIAGWELMFMNATGAVFGKEGVDSDDMRTLSLEHAYPTSRTPRVAAGRVDRRPEQSDAGRVDDGQSSDEANEG